MTRTTQFIGLNNKAKSLVAAMTAVESENHATGMYGEKIPLGKWVSSKDTVLGECVVSEVVQMEPWSSGVMIFTCLEAEFVNGQKTTMCQWVQCPTEVGYNAEEGIYWL